MSPLTQSATLDTKLLMFRVDLEVDFVRARSHKVQVILQSKLLMLRVALVVHFVRARSHNMQL